MKLWNLDVGNLILTHGIDGNANPGVNLYYYYLTDCLRNRQKYKRFFKRYLCIVTESN